MNKQVNKVKYIDSYSIETLHDQYNAAFLATVCCAYKNVEYIVGKSSFKHTSKLLNKCENLNYSLNFIWVVGGKSKIALLLRTFFGAIQNIRFLIFSKKDDLIIFNFNNFIFLYFANLLTKLFNRTVVIVCHNEMAFVSINSVHKNPIYNFRTNIIRYIFKNENVILSKNLRFCVLGDSIYDNLKMHINKNKIANFFSIDHPYIFSNKTSILKKSELPSNKIKIGVIGTMAQEKGADILISIAQKLNLLEAKFISIEIIGKIICDTSQFEKVGILLPPDKGKSFLDREKFNALVDNLDYILYLYPVNSYRFTASGSIMDAINFNKPIISFKNDFFQYIFSKYGNLGYLVENELEMVTLINKKIVPNNQNQHFNFESVKLALSPHELQKELLKSINNHEKNPLCC
jgi:hypothetical protein